MDILENLEKWDSEYQNGWLEHLKKTGEYNWDIYNWPKNSSAPFGKAVNLSTCKLALISTAGGFLKTSQEPFNASSMFGDYSMKQFPITTKYEELDYAHEHYNHDARKEDPQVNLPLRILEELQKESKIGSLANNVISFSGYHPNAYKVVTELIPQIIQSVKEQNANAAFLVPV